jgi:hypothetical protein
MRPIFFITIISLFLLTACGTPAPQVTVTSEVTVTLTPAATLTASPTFTEIPIPTPAPTLTPDQQTALDAAKVAYADTGWEIQPSGEVTGAPEGVTYDAEKGVLEYTHESYGVTITEPLIINNEDSVKPEGVVTDLQGYIIDENRDLVRKKMMGVDEVTGKEFETNVDAYSLQAGIQILLAELAKNPDVDRTESVERMNAYLEPFLDRKSGALQVTCNGVRLPYYDSNNRSGSSRADSWVYDQKLNKINAPFYAYVAMGKNGEYACMMTEIDGGLRQIAIDRPKMTNSKVGQSLWRIE